MKLKERVTNDMLVARRNNNIIQRNVLSVLITELEKIEKLDPKLRSKGEVTDNEVISVTKKLIESNIECKNEKENIYLDCYLPKKLTDTELETIIQKFATDNNFTIKEMGKIMSYLSNSFSGKYDGKKASELIKKILN